MDSTFTVNVAGEISSVNILGEHGDNNGTLNAEGPSAATNTQQPALTEDLKAKEKLLSKVCPILENLVARFNELCENLSVGQEEKIARLSVEIARKILMQKVQEGDYEIASIVEEALKNAPTRQDLVVHLNPEDLGYCQKIQQDEGLGALAGIEFVGDPNIGRAECVLVSPKGIIKSLINEHLEQIAKALEKA